MNPNRVPGVGSSTEYGFRQIMAAGKPQYLHGGAVIDGDYARDPLNTSYVDRLRAGLLMGRITASKLWAPSVIGVSGEAMSGDETEMTVAAAVVTELVRRVGASGTFKLTGPPSAGGTVRTSTVTYSAASGTAITMTALGTAEVQTITMATGTDGGTWRVKYANAVTPALQWNVSTADLQTALRALGGNLAAVTVTGSAGSAYTVTWPQAAATSGPQDLLVIVNDSTVTGGGWEGGVAVAVTAAGTTAVSAVNDVQTMTFQADADGGTFALRYRGLAIASQVFNVAVADLQTAIRALHADLATTVVSTVGGVGVDYVFTTNGVACADIEITADAITDGGVLEPASITHTTQGAAAVAGVANVQTLTPAAGTASGTFAIKYKEALTAGLAYNVSAADMQTAVRALHADLAATTVGLAGGVYTLTTADVACDVFEVVNDTTIDSALGGGAVVARTTLGVNGEFVTGSLIQPTDGSETILGIMGVESALKVTDDDGTTNLDVECSRMIVGCAADGVIDASQIINYPADASTKEWVKAALRAVGSGYVFDDDLIG